MSADEKLIWNPLTPGSDPAGARISAGKSGNVLTSLPNTAAVRVNCEPVSCMPSPESPANRMVTRSSSWTSTSRVGAVSVVTGASSSLGFHQLMWSWRQVEDLLRKRLGHVLQQVQLAQDAYQVSLAIDQRHVAKVTLLHRRHRFDERG